MYSEVAGFEGVADEEHEYRGIDPGNAVIGLGSGAAERLKP